MFLKFRRMKETLVVGEVKSLITDSAQTDMSNLSRKLPGHLNLPGWVKFFLGSLDKIGNTSYMYQYHTSNSFPLYVFTLF